MFIKMVYDYGTFFGRFFVVVVRTFSCIFYMLSKEQKNVKVESGRQTYK